MSRLYTFEQFLFEAKKEKLAKEEKKDGKKKPAPKKKAGKKKDQDGDGDSDFADAKIAQYTSGGVDKKKAIAMSRKFNKGSVTEMKKHLDDTISRDDFAKIKKGDKVKYSALEYKVVDNDEFVLTVTRDGKEKKINRKMFIDNGEIL